MPRPGTDEGEHAPGGGHWAESSGAPVWALGQAGERGRGVEARRRRERQ